MPTPCLIYGRISSTDRVVGSIKVLVYNSTKDDSLIIETNDKGEYVADAANFSLYYDIGDSIVISIYEDVPYMEDNVIVSNGKIEFV